MRHFITFLLSTCLFASCAYSVYPVADLNFYYDLKMQSAQEISAKSNVQIYLSEADIPGDYEVIAYVKYHPLTIPVLAPERMQQLKKFFKKAVLKADNLGGNGVLVHSAGFFSVIDVKSEDESAAEALTASDINLIMVSKVLEKIEDGSIYKADPKQQAKFMDSFKDEIEDNIKKCKTLEETAFVARKIDAYSNYYETIEKLTNSVVVKVGTFRIELKDVESKINKKLERQARREAAKAARE